MKIREEKELQKNRSGAVRWRRKENSINGSNAHTLRWELLVSISCFCVLSINYWERDSIGYEIFFCSQKRSIKHKTISRFSSRCTLFYCILLSHWKSHFGIVFLSLYPSHLSIGSLVKQFQVDAIKVHTMLSLSPSLAALLDFLLAPLRLVLTFSKLVFNSNLKCEHINYIFGRCSKKIACKFPYISVYDWNCIVVEDIQLTYITCDGTESSSEH